MVLWEHCSLMNVSYCRFFSLVSCISNGFRIFGHPKKLLSHFYQRSWKKNYIIILYRLRKLKFIKNFENWQLEQFGESCPIKDETQSCVENVVESDFIIHSHKHNRTQWPFHQNLELKEDVRSIKPHRYYIYISYLMQFFVCVCVHISLIQVTV